MADDITSANAVLMLTIGTLFPVPQQIQQFAADDVYDIAAIESVETMMGVDGVLSGGFVYKQVEQNIALMANSPSCRLFDAWHAQMAATKAVYTAQGLIQLPAIQTKFTQIKGFLTSWKPAPDGKKTLQPRRFRITWESIIPQPTL